MLRRGTADDFDAVLALADDPAILRSRWKLPSFDPARHLWLADGAFGALFAPDVAAVRGDAASIGPLLAAVERAARDEGLPQVSAVISARDEAACRAYEAAGFSIATEVLRMEVTLTAPPQDSPLPIRTYRDDDARAVQTLLDGAYLGWDDAYVRITHDDWLSFMTDHESFDPACWFVAEENGELQGVCLCWREGWIKDLAVAENARGRGLGEALLRHAFAALYARGVRRIGLKVDAKNPTSAIRLYERLGMQVVDRQRFYLKQL